MKKTMLWGALFTLITTQANSEATQQATSTQNPGSTSTNVVSESTNQVPATNQNIQNSQQNQVKQPVQTTGQQPTQTIQNNQQNQPTQAIQNNQQNQPTQSQAPTQQAAPVIDCNYKISAETKTIDQSLILTWSEKATTQAFDFEPTTIDVQLQKLQACFTDQGWQSFNSALQKSGNLDAIKSQKLHVSSQLDGQPQITEALENQWKITLPLQVVYQNDKEKVTQLLNVNITVGRKISGDLGINQMIATPRSATTLQQTNTSTNTTTPTTTTPSKPQDGAQVDTTTTTTQSNTGTPTDTTTTPNPSGGATTNTPNQTQ